MVSKTMSEVPLHDLVIRTISEYLRISKYLGANNNHLIFSNDALINLQRVNKRFYQLRDIFIGQIICDRYQSAYAYKNNPYGWNKVYHMSLCNNLLQDVSQLGSIKSLCVSYCAELRDVSALRHVHKLTLDVSNVRDFSMLGTVHTLVLDCCPFLYDVSPLWSVHSLTLANCSNVRDVSPLCKVHKLSLIDCCGISDFLALSGAHSLTIFACDNITDVSTLGGVNSLVIQYCPNIRDISMLSNVPNLTVKCCVNHPDIQRLRKN